MVVRFAPVAVSIHASAGEATGMAWLADRDRVGVSIHASAGEATCILATALATALWWFQSTPPQGRRQ